MSTKVKAENYKWYIDFDRTIFDSTKYINKVFDILDKLYKPIGVSRKQLEEYTKESYRLHPQGSNSGYNLFELLNTKGVSEAKVKEDLLANLKPDEFIYSDAFTALDWFDEIDVRPSILTLGQPQWQAFKLLICPRLGLYEQIIVQSPKGEFLSMDKISRPVILIDDNEVSLPDNCEQILIDRNNKYQGGMQKISLLTDIMEKFE